MSEKYLEMGVVGRAHGLKGEIGIDWHGENPIKVNDSIFLKNPADKDYTKYRVTGVRYHKGRPLVLLEGVADRTAAEKLNGHKVFVDRASLPGLEEDEAYLADIVGMRIKLPNGEILGVLDHVEFPANQEIWVIRTPENREILFPAQERFIESFDLDEKNVVINPPQGLVEIYNA